MGFEPSPEDLKYFDQDQIFKNRAEIKTLVSYNYFYQCRLLLQENMKIKEVTPFLDFYNPYIKLCMSKYMMGSKPSCLEKWNEEDWLEKDFTARERRDLFKKMEACQKVNPKTEVKFMEDMQVVNHYVDLLDKRVGLSSKLLPQLYKNVSNLPDLKDEEPEKLENVWNDLDRIIKVNGLEKQAELSQYNRDLGSSLKLFPLKYAALSREYFGSIMSCIKSSLYGKRLHLLSNEDILDRTTISQQLKCIIDGYPSSRPNKV